MGFNIGGMAAAYEGYTQGRDEETARQRGEEDRTYQKTQRDYLGMHQNRQREQWDREDARRTADAAVPTTRQVTETATAPYSGPRPDDQYPDQEMPGVTSKVTKTAAVPREEQIRQMAENARKAGAHDDWFKLTGEADKITATRSSQQFAELHAAVSSNSVSLLDAAKRTADIWNSAEGALQVSNPQQQGSTVTVDVYNRATGTKTTQTYQDNADGKKQFLTRLQALADPSNYNAILAEQRKLDAEIAKERGKPQVLKPGERQVAFDPAQGRSVTLAENEEVKPGFERVSRPDGSSVLQKVGTNQGVNEVLQQIAKLKSSDITETQYARANDIGQMIFTNSGGKVPAQMAASIALRVAKGEAQLKPAFNPDTGTIDMVYQDGMRGNVPVYQGVATPKNITAVRQQVREQLSAGGKTPSDSDVNEAAKSMMGDMAQDYAATLKESNPQGYTKFLSAAFNAKERAGLESELRGGAQDVIKQSTAGRSPEQQKAVTEAVTRALEQRVKSLANALDLIADYAPQLNPDPAKRPNADRPTKRPDGVSTVPVGGMPAAVDTASGRAVIQLPGDQRFRGMKPSLDLSRNNLTR